MTQDQQALRRRRARARARAAARAQEAAAGSGVRRKLMIALFGALAGIVLLGSAAGGGMGMWSLTHYDAVSDSVVPPEQLIAKLPSGGARIYDRHGVLLYEFVDELSGLRRPVALSEISPWMTKATISTEDASFYTNNGLNGRGLLRAAVENLTPFSSSFFEGSGGSSITQQLAKNVYIPRNERTQRSVDRKFKETVIALELTKRYSKDQILEWYLNSISYGGVYTGVQAAADGYFGKNVKDITLAEAALLAGIPQSPAAYAPLQEATLTEGGELTLQADSATKRRQLEVLRLMAEHGEITSAQADEAAKEEIAFRPHRFEIAAPHFVLGRVADEITKRFGEEALFRRGLEVTTTLDMELQKAAEDANEKYITEFGQAAGLKNGAVLAIDPKTGQILAYVGSRDYFRDDILGRNDNILGQNSPGSTLKPFTYMTAFTAGWGTGTAILDTPISLIDAATGQAYIVKDPVAYTGPITAADALGNSLNIPAVKTIQFAGVQNTVQMLKQVGYTTINNPGGYGPSLTVGGVDITLEDHVFAYTVLANGGVMRGQQNVVDKTAAGDRTLEPVSLLSVKDADGKVLYEFKEAATRRVVPAEFPYLITSILSDGSHQCITYGVCNALALPDGRPSAAKTGTSEPFANSRAIGETWTMGYTPNLVVGVWSGNADNVPIDNVIFSTSVSLRVWKDVMASGVKKLPPEGFVRPPGVVEREVCWPSGRLPTDLCPKTNRYTSLFAESVIGASADKAPGLYDSWWQRVKIDSRTGLLAAPNTPVSFVRDDVRLVFPAADVASWPGVYDWADKLGIKQLLAPTTVSTAGAVLVSLSDPITSSTVKGRLVITGHAASPKFQSYTLEFGRGTAPATWTPIYTSTAPVEEGTLGVWDTRVVPDGAYVLRVTLQDSERGQTSTQVSITVDNNVSGPPVGQAPLAAISAPTANATVRGAISISGVATSTDFNLGVIEIGAGNAPAQWSEIGRFASPVANGPLARWDTTAVPDGTYTLRLTVFDKTRGIAQANVTVAVKNK